MQNETHSLINSLKLLSLSWNVLAYLFPDNFDSSLDAWIFPLDRPSIFPHPTTHGVVPVACHSHNDCWRNVPLYSALAAGCISVEADIWISANKELLVGHTPFTLSQDPTLSSLYLDPLLRMLQMHNAPPANLSSTADVNRDDRMAGVFVNDPTQTLVLVVDS